MQQEEDPAVGKLERAESPALLRRHTRHQGMVGPNWMAFRVASLGEVRTFTGLEGDSPPVPNEAVGGAHLLGRAMDKCDVMVVGEYAMSFLLSLLLVGLLQELAAQRGWTATHCISHSGVNPINNSINIFWGIFMLNKDVI